MKITILTDDIKSWFIPYGKQLQEKLENSGHTVNYVFHAKEVSAGDICFLLSCVRLVPTNILVLNKNNIVVHASNLPEGKGFSPLQWQILEGRNNIALTLFEVVEKMDAGPYYLKSKLHFNGTELLGEMRRLMALKITEMCYDFVLNFDEMHPIVQTGEESFYRRRTVEDDELDVNKTIAEQFNHFRIGNNDTYPLYFRYNGEKYILKIYRANEECN